MFSFVSCINVFFTQKIIFLRSQFRSFSLNTTIKFTRYSVSVDSKFINVFKRKVILNYSTSLMDIFTNASRKGVDFERMKAVLRYDG